MVKTCKKTRFSVDFRLNQPNEKSTCESSRLAFFRTSRTVTNKSAEQQLGGEQPIDAAKKWGISAPIVAYKMKTDRNR